MKYILISSIPPKDFCRMPKGTKASYIVNWADATRAEQNITSYFTRLGGKVKWESYVSINPKTGNHLKTLIATVAKQGK